MRKRHGRLAVAAGFLAAIAGGLWLAMQVSSGALAGRDLALNAMFLLVPITFLVGAGVVMVVRGNGRPEPQSTVELQRRMMDVLNQHGQITIDEMATELGVSSRTVDALLEQLQQLDIFGGEIDHARGVLYSRQREH